MKWGYPGPGTGLPTSSLTSEGVSRGPGRGDVLHFPSKSVSLPSCSCASVKLNTHACHGHWNEVEAVVTQSLWAQGPTVLVVVRSHPSFHPYQQGIEERSPLLLGYPLKFRWTEMRVRRFSEGGRSRARGVGARAHTHLERHLGLVCPLGFGVSESIRQESVTAVRTQPHHLSPLLTTTTALPTTTPT